MRKSQVLRRSTWVAVIGLLGCGSSEAGTAAAGPSVSPQTMADALHAVLEADRTVYTKKVVNRLQNEKNVLPASEHWDDDDALPLPAQMFRMGAELVGEKTQTFSYALLSKWPVNKQNAPKTDLEMQGLEAVAAKKEPFYGEEKLGGKTYFTAIYPDVAIAPACVTCHNEHKDSPRSDFSLGDVMGGVVIRIPIGS